MTLKRDHKLSLPFRKVKGKISISNICVFELNEYFSYRCCYSCLLLKRICVLCSSHAPTFHSLHCRYSLLCEPLMAIIMQCNKHYSLLVCAVRVRLFCEKQQKGCWVCSVEVCRIRNFLYKLFELRCKC